MPPNRQDKTRYCNNCDKNFYECDVCHPFFTSPVEFTKNIHCGEHGATKEYGEPGKDKEDGKDKNDGKDKEDVKDNEEDVKTVKGAAAGAAGGLAAGTAGTAAVTAGAPAALGAVGFTSTEVASGSIAATLQGFLYGFRRWHPCWWLVCHLYLGSHGWGNGGSGCDSSGSYRGRSRGSGDGVRYLQGSQEDAEQGGN